MGWPFRQVLLMRLNAKSKPPYCFVPIALRVTFRPNLSPTWVPARWQRPLTREGGSLGSSSPSRTKAYRPATSTVPNLGLVRQPPATLSERIPATICEGCRFGVQRVKPAERTSLESWAVSVSAQEATPHPMSYFHINWTVYFSAPKQVSLYFRTV